MSIKKELELHENEPEYCSLDGIVYSAFLKDGNKIVAQISTNKKGELMNKVNEVCLECDFILKPRPAQ